MKSTYYFRLTLLVFVTTTQFVLAARPGAFNNDLLLLYLGIGLLLGLLWAIELLWVRLQTLRKKKHAQH